MTHPQHERRLDLPRLLQHFPPRVVWAVFTTVNGFLTIALLAALAMLSGTPLVFPSLGPTAFTFFFDPQTPPFRATRCLATPWAFFSDTRRWC
jgi:hypothetical protein